MYSFKCVDGIYLSVLVVLI